MTEIRVRMKNEDAMDRLDPETDRLVALPNAARKRRRGYGGPLLGGCALLLLLGGLAVGGWRHYRANLDVAAAAQQSRTLVPDVRVAAVRASDSKITVTLPATTTAFEAALSAGHTRIRPVLMTAAAMIVGMIPMAIGGAGEEQNAALARAVIGGLLFATPTTLLIVPYLFAMLRKGNDGKPHHGVFEEIQE